MGNSSGFFFRVFVAKEYTEPTLPLINIALMKIEIPKTENNSIHSWLIITRLKNHK